MLLCSRFGVKWRKGAYKLVEMYGIICRAFKKVVVGWLKNWRVVAKMFCGAYKQVEWSTFICPVTIHLAN